VTRGRDGKTVQIGCVKYRSRIEDAEGELSEVKGCGGQKSDAGTGIKLYHLHGKEYVVKLYRQTCCSVYIFG
jgi:hypothetical protein